MTPDLFPVCLPYRSLHNPFHSTGTAGSLVLVSYKVRSLSPIVTTCDDSLVQISPDS